MGAGILGKGTDVEDATRNGECGSGEDTVRNNEMTGGGDHEFEWQPNKVVCALSSLSKGKALKVFEQRYGIFAAML